MDKAIFASLLIFPLLFGCSQKQDNASKKVHIEENNSAYTLYKNGKPYHIKGAAGYSNLHTLKNIGGNTIRIWDTTHLAQILDSAKVNNLSVIVGLPIANSDYMALYNDPAKVSKQFKAFKSIVNRFKNNPAVLMWCLGNELDFPYKLIYNNFYNAINGLTNMIHKDDPDHPITTSVLNFNKKNIFNIKTRCDIDVISFNIFSRITFLRSDLKQAALFWNGPYMLLEWGINGPWEGTKQTAWGAYIEQTSNKKAEFYLNRYKKYMPTEDPRFLGSFVFFWGNKQEGTHTWFSMFDENSLQSEAVDVMRYLWTGKHGGRTFPQIKHMLLNKKSAIDNIILSPNSKSNAEVIMSDQHNIKSISWQIFKEDWYKKNNLHSTKKLKPLENLIKESQSLKIDFTAPKEEGPYRIFATIYDANGHFATCNIPFYVVTDK
ncbi:Glycosyl hydrolases family 2, TIM barrel domain [Pedobacter sp. ok626]|uniref:glycoside hydrolase family 2 TIM barrel-domain containing protein n=1 Tax=Pedobacter sp. ok626 TaxID=1761882 RepID=UPI000886BB4C|nr:glycoside hydrolase family 2 TIM barrel-domain containing protein [Pedobacter sp. ok626]SDJ76717.1 Glycosyl hydrolases family 2, TIM barrel domain [Pedobacter sp. ok626]